MSSKQDLGKFSLEGIPITCPHCKGEEFRISKAQLNTALATLLDLDWTNISAHILICHSCGQIQWFEKLPDQITLL